MSVLDVSCIVGLIENIMHNFSKQTKTVEMFVECSNIIILAVVLPVLKGQILEIPQGTLHGVRKLSYNNKSFISFEGIPYAQPPIGPLRFKEPVEGPKWNGVLYANKTYTCPQVSPIPIFKDSNALGHEDCLYLNVYVPEEAFGKANADLHVIVHIHGGGFVLGSPKMMAGPKYIMNHDVIYVNFNYRLGILGFLSFLDEDVSGNWGLKDQVLVLKWIKENIKLFGGNPDAVTLTGLSAGAASVHYHMLSEQSKGLFQKAVLLSGTAISPWALWKTPKENAEKLAELFDCRRETSKESVECLRNVPAIALCETLLNFTKFANVAPIAPFGPVIEPAGPQAFIDKHPMDILTSGPVPSDVPAIFGTVEDEGIFPVGYYVFLHQLDIMDKRWYEVMPFALESGTLHPTEEVKDDLERIKEYYFQEESLSMANVKNLTKLFSQRFFQVPMVKALKAQNANSKSPIFVYKFSYDSPAFFVFPQVPGVAHAEDCQLIFNLIVSPLKLVEQDEQMMAYMTNLIVDFARTGVADEKWSPLSKQSTSDLDYWQISGPNQREMQSSPLLAPDEDFWSSLSL